MKIGEKIRKYRKIRQATQLDLGYHVKLSNLRAGQYETSKRNPKEDLVIKFAQALDIEPAALSNTEPDTVDGLMHTLFDLEDTFELTIEEDFSDGEEDYIFRFKPKNDKQADELREAFASWIAAYKKYHSNPETEEEKQYEEDMYALWKAQFPNNFAKDDITGKTFVVKIENGNYRIIATERL